MDRKTVLVFGTVALGAATVFAACDKGPQALNAPEAPLAAAQQDLNGTPDLVVDVAKLANTWAVHNETFTAEQCSVEEGNIPPGNHRSLRFSVLINNIGDADLYVGDPLAHMDPNGDGNFADQDGLFEFASCHAHFHFRNYAKYELFPVNANGSLGTPVQSRKRGFCMLDTTPRQSNASPPKGRYYLSCGTLTAHGNQGISTGFGDEYVRTLPGQLFLLTDPAEPVPAGEYVIRVTANPPFTQVSGQACPVKDPQGFCHMFKEARYDNNVGEVRITIPTGVGHDGYGPGKANFNGEELDAAHHPEAHGSH
jgi:hypothetical protein